MIVKPVIAGCFGVFVGLLVYGVCASAGLGLPLAVLFGLSAGLGVATAFYFFTTE